MKQEMVYSVQEFADMFKISKNTVYAMIKRGDLQAYQVGNKIRISQEEVEAYKRRSIKPLLEKPKKKAKTYVISGHDAALDILGQRLQQKGFFISRVFQNSVVSLDALQKKQVDVASTHMWNPETDQYNVDYMQEIFPDGGVLLIRLFRRWQGFYVQKGNPKGLCAWRDLAKPDVVLINRELGSGTRKLLTAKLQQYQIALGSIHEYQQMENSTFGIIQAVADGRVDVGVGGASFLLSDKVDFIPLQLECYDLVIHEEDWPEAFNQALYEIICSKEYQQEISASGDYDLSETGKIVLSNG